MLEVRAPRAPAFARQILATSGPFLRSVVSDLAVLDVGCGYGHTAIELARECKQVVGIEPNQTLWQHACGLGSSSGCTNVEFRNDGIEALSDVSCYDLVVLDNVLEHVRDQELALRRVSAALKPGGVAFILVPNRLWPIEVHYGLPFLSYLPLRLANCYLRMTGRGRDYSDASYAPSYSGLKRLLGGCKELAPRFVLPADVSLATLGRSFHYRLGVAAIRRFPWLWAISKVFLVIAVKQ